MSNILFPEIQEIDLKYDLPSSVRSFFKVLTNSETKSTLRKNHVINQAKNILDLIPQDVQTYLVTLTNLVNSKTLDGQFDFFRTALSLGEDYSESNISVWAKDLFLDSKEIIHSSKELSFDAYERIHKQEGKINILEDAILNFKDRKNLHLATIGGELEKNLISYGGLGIVINDLKFKNPKRDETITLSCSISKNNLFHTDPSWYNKLYREGGDNTYNQHNFLYSLFKDTSAIAVSNNSFHASNYDLYFVSTNSFIEKLSSKLFVENNLKRRQSKTSASEKYLSKVDNNINEYFLDDKIMDGTFILSLINDYKYS